MFRMALGVDIEEILAQTEWLSSLDIFFLAIHTLGTDQSTTLINLRDNADNDVVFEMLDPANATDIPEPLVFSGVLSVGEYTLNTGARSDFHEVESESGITVIDFLALLCIQRIPEASTFELFGDGLVGQRRRGNLAPFAALTSR